MQEIRFFHSGYEGVLLSSYFFFDKWRFSFYLHGKWKWEYTLCHSYYGLFYKCMNFYHWLEMPFQLTAEMVDSWIFVAQKCLIG